MELTLGVPCQALLLFDADFPDGLFTLALNALAISPSDSAEQYTAQTIRLSINSLEQLQNELDKHTSLKGRYIVLPNVSEKGPSTLLRSGHGEHYKAMPCVGGYLDGSISQLGVGNKRILDGLDHQYGNKALGIFQTSDNRRRDFEDLGRHTTWVKWAEPTAEAIRQACLARQSRLSQLEPVVPTTAITAIDVSNSAFMGPVYLEFNPQYNAFIGGRGTGKSTLLEYIRWALCDQPPQFSDDERDELGQAHVRRRKLIEQTLVPHRAVVSVHFTVNAVPHMVRRHSATGEISLKIGSAPLEPCQETDIRSLLPIQAYSQKQLSSIGVRLDELRRFIRTPIRKELEDIRGKLAATGAEIGRAYAVLRTKRKQERDLENDERELRSLIAQTTAIRGTLAGIDSEHRKVLESHTVHEKEAELVGMWKQSLTESEKILDRGLVALRALTPVEHSNDLSELPNLQYLRNIRAAIVDAIEKAQTSLTEQRDNINRMYSQGSLYSQALIQWERQHEAHETAYALAKTRSTTHQTKLTELDQLEVRVRTIQGRIAAARAAITSIGNPEEPFRAAREQWCLLHEERSELLAHQCKRLTELSEGQIRATLAKGNVTDSLADRLKAIVSGTGIRSAKIDELCNSLVTQASPIRQTQLVMSELEQLSMVDTELSDEHHLPDTPLLVAAGFSAKELLKISKKLSPDAWTDVCTTSLDDQPQFQYRLREEEYIPFADASAGQQATSLLWALLNQDGPPLLIDQPEDDLDNQILLKIVEQIWRAKQRRQLLFTSHNANVVVNGDADLVVCCDYRVMGEQSGGVIKALGAIDVAEVRNEIATVMEGGKAAFSLRKDKYGF